MIAPAVSALASDYGPYGSDDDDDCDGRGDDTDDDGAEEEDTEPEDDIDSEEAEDMGTAYRLPARPGPYVPARVAAPVSSVSVTDASPSGPTGVPVSAPEAPVPWRSSVAFVKETTADVSWLVPGVLPAGGVVLLSGREGSMKTWLALSLARSVAAGTPWLGRATTQGPVLYLDGEMQPSVLKQRLQGLGVTDALHVWGWKDGTFPESLNHADLRRAAQCHTLIVIDTLRRHITGLKENNADDMAIVTRDLRELARYGATVLVLHHAAKDIERTGYRGSTELGAGVDITLSLMAKTLGGKKLLRLETDKSRYPLSADLEITVTNGKEAPGFSVQGGGTQPEAETCVLVPVMKSLAEQIGKAPTQGQIIEAARKNGLGGKDKIRRILEDGVGKYWKTERKGNAVSYTPIEP